MTTPREVGFEIPGVVADRLVRGRVALPEGPGPFPCAVLVHGFTVSCDWGFWPELVRRLAARGVASARFAFSGDGVGPDLRTVEDLDAIAKNTYVAELADLTAVRAHVLGMPALDPDRSVLVGHSRGGGIGVIHAAEDGGYRAVALWAAFDRILRFSPERLRRWRAQGWIDVMHHGLGQRVRLDVAALDSAERHRDRLDVLAAARRLTCPVLVVHGARDAALPLTCAENLARAAPDAELVVIDDAGHAFGARDPLRDVPERLEALLSKTVAWLGRTLGQPDSMPTIR